MSSLTRLRTEEACALLDEHGYLSEAAALRLLPTIARLVEEVLGDVRGLRTLVDIESARDGTRADPRPGPRDRGDGRVGPSRDLDVARLGRDRAADASIAEDDRC